MTEAVSNELVPTQNVAGSFADTGCARSAVIFMGRSLCLVGSAGDARWLDTVVWGRGGVNVAG